MYPRPTPLPCLRDAFAGRSNRAWHAPACHIPKIKLSCGFRLVSFFRAMQDLFLNTEPKTRPNPTPGNPRPRPKVLADFYLVFFFKFLKPWRLGPRFSIWLRCCLHYVIVVVFYFRSARHYGRSLPRPARNLGSTFCFSFHSHFAI